MSTAEKQPTTSLAPLVYAWLGLLALTLLSFVLSEHFHGMDWLQPLVAIIIGVKGILVARQFIEVDLSHPLIRRVVYAFVAFTPLMLAIVTYFGAPLARWTSL